MEGCTCYMLGKSKNAGLDSGSALINKTGKPLKFQPWVVRRTRQGDSTGLAIKHFKDRHTDRQWGRGLLIEDPGSERICDKSS